MNVRLMNVFILVGLLLAACSAGGEVTVVTVEAPGQPTAQPTASPVNRPAIVIEPASARAGTIITIRGMGFPPGQMIRFFVGPRSVGAAGEPYEGVQVAADGTFTGKLIAPAGWPSGELITQPELVIVAANDDFSVQASADFTLTLDSTSKAQTVPQAAQIAQQMLAEQLAIGVDAVRLVSVEHVDWPDGCLGIHQPGVACIMVITPGYRVILEANGKRYEYHTNESGSYVVQAAFFESDSAAPGIVWQPLDNPCEKVSITVQGVRLESCSGKLTTSRLANEARLESWSHFVKTYAPFTAETSAGRVVFSGVGKMQASAVEQRMIAEWAQWVALEAKQGPGAAPSPAFVWYREGGVAGYCDSLTVYLSGEVYYSSCKLVEDIAPRRLTAAQLAQLYAWSDALKSFEYVERTPARADALTIRLVFNGAGSVEPADSDKIALSAFANELLALFNEQPQTS